MPFYQAFKPFPGKAGKRFLRANLVKRHFWAHKMVGLMRKPKLAASFQAEGYRIPRPTALGGSADPGTGRKARTATT